MRAPTHYDRACPGIAGRLLTAREAAEADAMRAALVDRLIDEAGCSVYDAWAGCHELDGAPAALRRAAWATVLALLLAPEAT